MRRDPDTLVVILHAILIGLVIAYFVIGGLFADESKAVNALDSSGYTEVTITNKEWVLVGLLGCGNDDTVKFSFTAKNPIGQEVNGFVCQSPFKGATIRF